MQGRLLVKSSSIKLTDRYNDNKHAANFYQLKQCCQHVLSELESSFTKNSQQVQSFRRDTWRRLRGFLKSFITCGHSLTSVSSEIIETLCLNKLFIC